MAKVDVGKAQVEGVRAELIYKMLDENAACAEQILEMSRRICLPPQIPAGVNSAPKSVPDDFTGRVIDRLEGININLSLAQSRLRSFIG